MILKEKYKDVNLVDEVKRYLEKEVKNEHDKKTFDKTMKKIYIAYSFIKENNFEKIIIALDILAKKITNMNIEIEVLVKDNNLFEALYDNSHLWVLLAWRDGRSSLKMELYNNSFTSNSIFIKAPSEDAQKIIKEILDEICEEWDDVFDIKLTDV